MVPAQRKKKMKSRRAKSDRSRMAEITLTGAATMHMAENKRSRTYETTDRIEHWNQIDNASELKDFLAAWMRDLKTWGQDVRDDIIRLETAVGVASGDPGDPPPAPRTPPK